MGILDGIIGGVVSAGLTAAVKNLVEKQGGIQGLVSKFEQGGLGDIAKSWVSTGANQPVNGQQLQAVLGNDSISQMASSLGLPVEKITAQLAEHLPEYIDKLTPNGQIPTAEAA